MRAIGSKLQPDETIVTIDFEGQVVKARAGESLAAALTANGIKTFRVTREGEERGLFCGMGVCHECLVDIEGLPAQLACMHKVTGPLSCKRHVSPARLAIVTPSNRRTPWFPLNPDVLVIGGGAGGLTAAATAAENGASVVVIDERPAPGGQFFKQQHAGMPAAACVDDPQFAEGRQLIARCTAAGVTVVEGAAISASLPLSVTVAWLGTVVEFRPYRLIVATGAYERPLPVPGWTLPGVMTTGAAQTLLRSYRVLVGKRIVIAGNGPLNFQVAVELQKAGAEIMAVAELAPSPGLRRAGALASMAASSPALLLQGMQYLRELRNANIPVYFDAILKKIQPGLGTTLAAVISSAAKHIEVTADIVCMGYGFLSSNELLRLLQCRHDYDERRRHLVTFRDSECRTSVAGVFGIGDCCGLNGARVAIAEGIIAGQAAAAEATNQRKTLLQNREIAAARYRLDRHRRFQTALWRLFAPLKPFEHTDPDTEICRCESVSLSAIEMVLSTGSDAVGSIKRQSRLGMGRCQGRYCIYETVERICRSQGNAPAETLFSAPRPPVKPLPLSVFDGPI